MFSSDLHSVYHCLLCPMEKLPPRRSYPLFIASSCIRISSSSIVCPLPPSHIISVAVCTVYTLRSSHFWWNKIFFYDVIFVSVLPRLTSVIWRRLRTYPHHGVYVCLIHIWSLAASLLLPSCRSTNVCEAVSDLFLREGPFLILPFWSLISQCGPKCAKSTSRTRHLREQKEVSQSRTRWWKLMDERETVYPLSLVRDS